MAAAAATVLFFLFSLASGNSDLDQPKNDFFSTDPSSVFLSDSNPMPRAAIILPSERPELESASFVEIKPEEPQLTDSNSFVIKENEEKSGSVSESLPDSLPATTVVTLRPINRRFSRGSLFPIRRGFKCHGHRRYHHLLQLRQRFSGQRFNGQRDQVSFGNDMILSKDQDRGFDPAHSGDGQSLAGWAKHHHGEQSFSLTKDDKIRQNLYGMSHANPHFHHHRRHHHSWHHHEDDDEEKEEEEDRREHESGIINAIRRFLNF